MKVKELLEERQPIAYKTLYNAFLHKQTSHAYLLSGAKGVPLKECAIFLAQSLVCEDPSPLACEECLSCIRLKNGSYTDFTFINEEGGNINKDAIENLQLDFSRTGLEEKGIKIYVIHLIENANSVAVNRLLKFLEEPSANIVGILTTENIAKVLPTIISRCQIIRLKGRNKDVLVNELIAQDIAPIDAKILSTFNNSLAEAEQIINETSYYAIKDLAHETFQTLFQDPLKIHYYVQQEVAPKLNDRREYGLYLDILEIYFKELLYGRLDEFLEQKFEMNELAMKYIKLDDAVMQIMLARGKLESNVNGPLLLDQLFYQIAKKGGLI